MEKAAEHHQFGGLLIRDSEIVFRKHVAPAHREHLSLSWHRWLS